MPRYRNVSGARIAIGGKEIMPGKEVETLTWFEESASLQLVDELPMHNPILLSESIEKDSEISIPYFDRLNGVISRYLVHSYAEHGDVAIFYNSLKNTPPLKLYAGGKWNERCYERTIHKMFVRFLNAEGKKKLWIIVERI
jgi:hypothetical protein